MPVNFVSYYDALSYCDYLTEKDGENTYRLPTESEWELAAGHMPKDADFNCNTDGERSPVTEYASVTRGARRGRLLGQCLGVDKRGQRRFRYGSQGRIV